MQHNVTLPLEAAPTASQTTPQYHVVLAVAGFAFTLTTMEPTQPIVRWQDKSTAPLERPSSFAVTLIAHAPPQSKPKNSWLSAAAKRIRDKIPTEEWDKIPTISADDLDRNLYGA